jgi:hypothetical protein
MQREHFLKQALEGPPAAQCPAAAAQQFAALYPDADHAW